MYLYTYTYIYINLTIFTFRMYYILYCYNIELSASAIVLHCYVTPALLTLWCFVHLACLLICSFSAKGYSVPRAFIAAQSPMSHTKGDFWELVWQFRTPTIVLLSNYRQGKQVRVACTIPAYKDKCGGTM